MPEYLNKDERKALVEEFREVSSTDDWLGLDSAMVARYVHGQCSKEEAEQVRKILTDQPCDEEAVSILTEMVTDLNLLTSSPQVKNDEATGFPTSLSHSLFLKSEPSIGDVLTAIVEFNSQITGFNQLVMANESLFDAMESAINTPAEQIRLSCGDAVLDYDPLFALAAGADDNLVKIATSPLWYSKLMAVPEQLRWDPAAMPAGGNRFCVRVAVDSLDMLSKDVSALKATLPGAEFPASSPISWSIAESASSEPFVAGVFALLTKHEIAEVDAKLNSIDTSADFLHQEMSACAVLFSHDLLHDTLLKLRHLDELYSQGFPKFVVHRSLSSVYGAVARRLSGAPFWMGDREGLWATETASEYLKSAWAAIGIQYEV
jgi:hypothetical protein